VLVANTSFRDLQPRLDEVAAIPGVDSVVTVEGEWGSGAGPGDVLVVDFRSDRDQVAEAGRRGVPWLHILSAGIDSFDLDRLPFPVITCSRAISGGPIAEWVIAMILAHEKRLATVFAGERVKLPLGELRGQTLGVFGLGGIGGHTARLALAFGMRVKGTRRHADRPLPAELAGVEVVEDVSALVGDADHVAICSALTPVTRHVFDDALFAGMKPGAHLVNIARGGIVDHAALLRALDDGRVGHASLDVTEPEPLSDDHPLRHHPRATVTPHVSGLVARAEERNWQSFADNLRRHLAGGTLIDLVDREEGY
jgi:phosphoglycerate dehydrogenase-like enzyme